MKSDRQLARIVTSSVVSGQPSGLAIASQLNSTLRLETRRKMGERDWRAFVTSVSVIGSGTPSEPWVRRAAAWGFTLEDARARLLHVEERRLGVMVARSARMDELPRSSRINRRSVRLRR